MGSLGPECTERTHCSARMLGSSRVAILGKRTRGRNKSETLFPVTVTEGVWINFEHKKFTRLFGYFPRALGVLSNRRLLQCTDRP